MCISIAKEFVLSEREAASRGRKKESDLSMGIYTSHYTMVITHHTQRLHTLMSGNAK